MSYLRNTWRVAWRDKDGRDVMCVAHTQDRKPNIQSMQGTVAARLHHVTATAK